MKDNKLLIILPWNNVGAAGVEQYMILLVNNLPIGSYKVHICAISNKKIAAQEVISRIQEGVSFSFITTTHIRNSIGEIRQIIKEEKPNIIIANVFHICLAALIAKFLSNVKCKFISVNHGINLFKFSEKIYAFFVGLFSDKIIAVSQGIKDDLVNKIGLNPCKIDVIYNAFDIAQIQEKSKQEIKSNSIFNSVHKKIIYVGRLDEKQKAVSVLIQSFSLLLQQRKDAILIFVGEGEERKKITKMSKNLGVQNNVYFYGWQENPYPFIKKSDVLVLSSRYEGFGRILVESLACGTPVVSTNCHSGPAEILENGKYGKLVPVEDSHSLARAIEETLQEPIHSDKLISRARYFSIQKLVHQYLKILADISQ